MGNIYTIECTCSTRDIAKQHRKIQVIRFIVNLVKIIPLDIDGLSVSDMLPLFERSSIYHSLIVVIIDIK